MKLFGHKISIGMFAAFAVAASFVVTGLMSDEAHAACSEVRNTDHYMTIGDFVNNCTNLAPGGVMYDIYYGVVGLNYNTSYRVWISKRGEPKAIDIDVPYGTSRVDLQVNSLVYNRTALRKGASTKILWSNSELNGRTLKFSYPQSATRYRIPDIENGQAYFGYTIPESIRKTPGRHSITVSMTEKSIHQDQSGALYCVSQGPGSTTRRVPNWYSHDLCTAGSESYTFWLNVGNPPQGWNIQGESYVYSRAENKHYANYDNSNAAYANAHASQAPVVYPGQTAEFTTNLRNIALADHTHVNSSVQAVVDMAYFKTYSDVANCSGQNWLSNCGGTPTEKDTRTRIVYGAGILDNALYSGRDICKSVRSNIIQAPNNLTGWSAAGSGGEDCMRLKVPEGTSRIGQYLCTKTSWYYAASNNSGWNSSTPACVYVASDFELVPSVGSSSGSTSIGQIEQGSATNLISTIRNFGGPRGGAGVSDAGVYTFAFTKAASAASNSDIETRLKTVFNRNKESYHFAQADFAASGSVCDWMSSQASLVGTIRDCALGATTKQSFDTTTDIDSSPIDASRYEVGDIVCRVAVVNRYDWSTNQSDTARRISYPRCYRITKKPMVQVWGGDLRVGSGYLQGSTQQYKSGIYTGGSRNILIGGTVRSIGSWAEYGLYAPSIAAATGSNVQSASAGALSGVGAGAHSGVLTPAERNRLTFANTGATYGQWGRIGTQNTFVSSHNVSPIANSSSSISLDSLGQGLHRLTGSSQTVTVSGTVASGRTVIIDGRDKTVVIDNDIRYAQSSHSTPNTIPQLIIIGRNIIIKDTVQNVDAWLIAVASTSGAGGVVSTCETVLTTSAIAQAIARTDYTQGLNSNICNAPLQINGPVSARVLQLRRTYGAESLSGSENGYTTPAEIINMRFDIHLWAYGYATSNGSIGTDATTELPVRY